MKSRVLLPWVMVLCLCGCSRPPAVIVKVVVHIPGASPSAADSLAVPLRTALFAASHAERMETVAREGQWEAYVQIRSNNAIQDVRSVTQSAVLPVGASAPDFSIQAGTMPEIVPVMRPELNVVIDRQKAGALGITAKEITDAMAQATLADKKAGLGDIIVATRNGAIVKVRDVATFEEKDMPDCIVQHWP